MSPSPRAPRAAGAAIFRFEGSGHARALRCARGLPLKSNGDPSATRPRMRNATRCSRGYAPLPRREVMNDESRGELDGCDGVPESAKPIQRELERLVAPASSELGEHDDARLEVQAERLRQAERAQ